MEGKATNGKCMFGITSPGQSRPKVTDAAQAVVPALGSMVSSHESGGNNGTRSALWNNQCAALAEDLDGDRQE